MERTSTTFSKDVGLARQKEIDELRGRIDRLEQQLRARRESETPDG